MNNYSSFLTSQLVIRHMLTGDDNWKNEFERRLQICGSDKIIAEKVYCYIREIFEKFGTHGIESLVYIRSPVFSMNHKNFDKTLLELVRENRLTPSEVMNILDEAECIYAHFDDDDDYDEVNEDSLKEIFEATRYSGGEYFIEEIEKLTHLGMTDEQALAMMKNDQDIIFIYKWHQSVPHPYE